jgi:hypothetical protein
MGERHVCSLKAAAKMTRAPKELMTKLLLVVSLKTGLAAR